jgi:hypothetical protein
MCVLRRPIGSHAVPRFNTLCHSASCDAAGRSAPANPSRPCSRNLASSAPCSSRRTIEGTSSEEAPSTAAAIPPVDERADERTESHLRNDRSHRGCSKNRSRSGLERKPPDQRELNQLAPEQREDLAAPDGEEAGLPPVGPPPDRMSHSVHLYGTSPRYGARFTKAMPSGGPASIEEPGPVG